MYSKCLIFTALLLCLLSCSPYLKMRRIQAGETAMALSVAEEKPLGEEKMDDAGIEGIRSTLSDEPIIMNAIRDSETGEMVATDIIRESKVVARFRNVAERAGYVSVSFDVSVPALMADSRWQLKILPVMNIQEDTVGLDALYVTGEGYRANQLRGYQRYRSFLASIITDTADFIRMDQLEIFLQRHYPETYAMKNDSSFVPEPAARNVFGVTQREALEHYTDKLRKRLNERRKSRKDYMFGKYVKDPIVREGVRLDTVISSSGGDFIYRYVHTFRSRPGLRKVTVSLDGKLYDKGRCIHEFPFPEGLTFYISSLSGLADDKPKYIQYVLERMVYDNTKALIDFDKGSYEIDTVLGDNASELRRVRRCIDDVVARDDLELDSLVIVASCSPEGSYDTNRKLSLARSESVRRYIGDFVPRQWSLKTSSMPENWGQLQKLIANDTTFSEKARKRLLGAVDDVSDPDAAEYLLSGMPEYRYLREKLYPQLRSVSFEFYMHRSGIHKDTVHTTVLDTVYMSGLKALRDLDYSRAVAILRPYGDYNTALAFMSADYNHSALDVLGRLDDRDPKVCYLKAMVLSRMHQHEEAMKYYRLSVAYDPYMRHRANLDPEMHLLVKEDDMNF